MNGRDFVRILGYDPHHVTVVGMRIPEAYAADYWEVHWEMMLEGELGHWLPEIWAQKVERLLGLARKPPDSVPQR